jgi:hypothetical protein
MYRTVVQSSAFLITGLALAVVLLAWFGHIVSDAKLQAQERFKPLAQAAPQSAQAANPRAPAKPAPRSKRLDAALAAR